MEKIQTDYLVIGSGAAGMAFIDVMLKYSDAKIVVVDRHHAPGGHWNDAYPFVRLHQPSSYYGVCSRPLGTDALDPSPLNTGMAERASAAELLAYYERLMVEYVATGRVTYIPRAEYHADQTIRYLMTDRRLDVKVTQKIVDTTYLGTAVPATHPPRYEIADGVRCITPTQLTSIKGHAGTYTVVGAGKTGVDVCLWLLENGVSPDQIRWVMPRDAWWQNRANVQRGDSFFEATFGALAAQMESVAQARAMADLFGALEDKQQLLRIDPAVTPSMYHGAIMSLDELSVLRSIKDVVRMGRILRIDTEAMTLEKGSLSVSPDTLFIDCSASGLTRKSPIPVFNGARITLQMVKPIQPVFSAALIARIETLDIDKDQKNGLSPPSVVPDTPDDWLRVLIAGATTQAIWAANSELKAWIASTRLDTFGMMARAVKPDDTARLGLLHRLSAAARPAVGTALRLLDERTAAQQDAR